MEDIYSFIYVRYHSALTYHVMKKLFLFVLFFTAIGVVYSQRTNVYQTGIVAQQNLNAVAGLKPYSDGALGFDNRYEGIKGTPRMFDTLLPSYLLLNDNDIYIKLDADLDMTGNAVLYIDPKTKTLFELPAESVKELIIENRGNELVFRSTAGLNFEKPLKDVRLYQALYEGAVLFIKVPEKKFLEADYKGPYSADRRYDEYLDVTKYYIALSDGLFHEVQLSRNSLIKLFPDKKELINSSLSRKTSENNEDLVISLLEKL